MTRGHLISNRGDDVPCLHGQVHTRDPDHRTFVQRVRKSDVERPINRVRPRIRVPDSTTPANPREEMATLMVNEAANFDIETVTSSDNDGPEDGWLEQPTGTPT